MRGRLLLATVLLAVCWVSCAAEPVDREKSMPLKVKPDGPHGSFIGCLRPVLAAAGSDWSLGKLHGFLGPAFTFSMNADGGGVWQAGNYEWDYFFEMLKYFGKGVEVISGPAKGNNAVPAEKIQALKADAWSRLKESVDRGVPAIIWNAMTPEQKASGKDPLPHMWSIVVGYDEAAKTVTVRHSNCPEFTIKLDDVGRADPVNWFCLITVKPGAKLENEAAAHRAAIQCALDSAEGKNPGGDAIAHGLRAWEMWLKAFKDGTAKPAPAKGHIGFLRGARSNAAAYLKEIRPAFPEGAQKALAEAAELYEQEVAALAKLAAIAGNEKPNYDAGAAVLADALEKERAALAKLKTVVDERR